MYKKLFLIASIFFIVNCANAQSLLKGTVIESGNNSKLPDVFIRDNNTKKVTISDDNGNFELKTEIGHTLIFECPGYVSDTLYVINFDTRKIVMVTQTIALREVSVNARKENFDPHKEYADVYTKSKVYVLSPTTWFSKEGKDARRLKHYFVNEEQERRVDAVFTRAYVGSIVPLKGQDLEDFMTLYRPTYAFITSNDSKSLAVYINDSYTKFKALPPGKRSLPALVTQ